MNSMLIQELDGAPTIILIFNRDLYKHEGTNPQESVM